jgi:hypothetical protein
MCLFARALHANARRATRRTNSEPGRISFRRLVASSWSECRHLGSTASIDAIAAFDETIDSPRPIDSPDGFIFINFAKRNY